MTEPLAWVDRDYDRTAATGSGRKGSRLRNYLKDRAEQFDGLCAVEHAINAWAIATGPIMAPGYVQFRGDLERIRLDCDEDGRLVARIEARLPHRVLATRYRTAVEHFEDWRRESSWASPVGAFAQYAFTAPPSAAFLLTAQLTVHLGGDELAEPRGERLDYALAVSSIDLLVEKVNTIAGPVIDTLREGR